MRLSLLPLIVTSLTWAAPFAKAQSLPEGANIVGVAEQTPTGLTTASDKPVIISGDVLDARQRLVFRGRTGEGNPGILLGFKDAEGEVAEVALISRDTTFAGTTYPQAHLTLGWFSIKREGGGISGWSKWNFRPYPNLYHPKEWERRKEEWAAMPKAPEIPFTLELRPVEGGIEFRMEGLYLQTLPLGEPTSFRVRIPQGGMLESLEFLAPIAHESETLSVARHPRDEGLLPEAELHFASDANLPPGLTADGSSRIDITGLGSFGQWRSDDLQSLWWRRTALHNLPEQRMFSVPLAVWSHAWVLCAAPDDADGNTAFTFRVTRYGASRGDAMADTLVRLPSPDAASTADARRVGTVRYGEGAEKKEAPLWLLRVPIHNGKIQDLIYSDDKRAQGMPSHRYLDVELLDPLPNLEPAHEFPPRMDHLNRVWKPLTSEVTAHDIYPNLLEPTPGKVAVFGIQLERSPAELKVGTGNGSKVFYAAENPEFKAEVIAHRKGDYRIEWEVADVERQIVHKQSEKVTINNEKSEVRLPIPLTLGNGWFSVRTRLLEADGRELVDHRSSFVMLPPDRRKAGLESPYYGWWFGKNHHIPLTLEEVGPLLQRLGVRRVEMRGSEELRESVTLPKYGFTEMAVPWTPHRAGFTRFRKGEAKLTEVIDEYEASIRKHLELWPSTDHMLVFHESGAAGAPFPTELWGEPAVNRGHIADENSPQALLEREGQQPSPREKRAEEVWKQTWPARMEYITSLSKMVREKFPHLKMQYGNDGNSLALVGEIFRQKFPREMIDTIAIEDLGQTIVPEHPRLGGVHSAWFLRELARKTGYGDVPITACTEWIGRMTERLGHKTQAEWKVRDALLGLGYGLETLSIAGLNDAGNAYYFSIWANGGLLSRYPEMAPKPSFAAIATLTQQLDSAKYRRFVPTGSTVLYVQEFQRGNEWIYALWTPRGSREVTLQFPNDTPRTLTDLYGREQSLTGDTLKLEASTAPHYLTSSTQIGSVQAGASSFPDDPAPAEVLEEIPLESLDDLEIVLSPQQEEQSRRNTASLPHLRQGKAEVREVDDPEMGRCLEIELIPEGDLRWPMEHEYVMLKLKQPLKTEAKNAGLWIKGNGSWGSIEITKTQPWGPWATNSNIHINWPAQQRLNFDDWNFIRYPYYDWVRTHNNAVTGIMLTLPRQTIVGNEMEPVKRLTVRVKKIVLF